MCGMQRPIREMPPMFSSREIVHLTCLCGILIVLLLSLGKIRDPKSWYWLWEKEWIDTQVALDAEPFISEQSSAESADHDPSTPLPIPLPN